MLSKCANPSCSAPFLYLHEGKLFRVEVPSATSGNSADPHSGSVIERKAANRLEYYWLCDSCAAQMTIVRNERGSIRTAPLFAMRAAS